MRLPNVCGLLTASALLIGATSANALVLTLEELDSMNNVIASETIIDDGANDDANSVEGAISYNGSVGSFFLNITSATGDAILGAGDDRISGTDLTYNSLSSGSGTLRITLLEEDISIETSIVENTARFSAEIDPTDIGDSTSVQTFFNINDTGDQLIAEDLNRTDSAGPDVTNTVVAALMSSDTFDLTTVVVLNHDKADQSVGGVSIDVAAVPLPAALPLFLTALVGLGFVGRHRRRQAA